MTSVATQAVGVPTTAPIRFVRAASWDRHEPWHRLTCSSGREVVRQQSTGYYATFAEPTHSGLVVFPIGSPVNVASCCRP